MIEVAHAKAGFLLCELTIDTDLVGITNNGTTTQGAVLALTIIAGTNSLKKPGSRYASSVEAALGQWSAGDGTALDGVGVHFVGTEFQVNVLKAMRSVPLGTTTSYRQLAKQSGYPNAIRAVASVCAQNRIPLIIPCHRVVKSDGSIGKYFYGSELKQQLLLHEAS